MPQGAISAQMWMNMFIHTHPPQQVFVPTHPMSYRCRFLSTSAVDAATTLLRAGEFGACMALLLLEGALLLFTIEVVAPPLVVDGLSVSRFIMLLVAGRLDLCVFPEF